MNSDLDDLAAEAIAAANRWQSSAQDELAAIAAYHDLKEHEKHMSKEQPPLFVTSGDTRLILAGTHACSLALLVLDNKPKHPLALAVLDDWGLESKELTKEEVPTPEPKLVWPPVDLSGRPLAFTLSPAYFKVYYHAYEVLLQSRQSDPTVGQTIGPSETLKLLDARWSEEDYAWRMHFTTVHLGENITLWVSHCSVHPGEQIPDAPSKL